MKLRGAEDRGVVLEEVRLDQAALMAFVGGQCHGLALAIQEETGWPLVAVDSKEGVCEHICVRRDDQLLVDITGAHSDDEIRAARGGSLRELDRASIETLVADYAWSPPDP